MGNIEGKKIENGGIFSRETILLGDEAVCLLSNAHVAVFGLGGVGGAAAEALVRAGIGEITLVDGDRVSESNINRQIIADIYNVGEFKTDCAEKRFSAINPNLKINKITDFFTENTAENFDFAKFDFVCDAIDSVPDKLLLIKNCKAVGTEIVSAMGTGNKLCPEKFEIADIYKTEYCPLARKMRGLLKKENIDSLAVVYSKEEPKSAKKDSGIVGSISFVPPAAGLLMASYIVKKLLKIKE